MMGTPAMPPLYKNIFTCMYVYIYNYIIYEPGSKLLVLGMVIQPLIGNPYNGYINPHHWVDEFIPYGNNGS